MVLAMATSVPSRSLPMQPASSHLMPLASVVSFGARASPSAASQSRNAKVSLPDLTMASRPSAPRTATALPSGEISTSGCGARTIMTIEPPISTTPIRRNGVLSRQSSTSPSVQTSSGPVPNAAIRPSDPGKLATQSAIAVIHSMP